ncbi:MAG: hypothetical protein CVU09_06200 [Bacteroidetes bacterium HGW-Bacteroidetes-4]|nr:MAG: hypothetical protein CVU09_06200 [Bacteroidetes bacterium HGW-Bacteroidetes-4]
MKTTDENKTKKNLQPEGKKSAGSKSPMKKRRWIRRGQLILSWSFAAIVLIVFGVVLYLGKNKQAEILSELKMEKTELILQLDDRDNLIDDMVTTFNEIETDLMRITEKENLIEFETGDMEYNRTKKEKIIDNISYINTLLDDNKKRISYLNKRLKDSGLKMSSLEQKIANLEQSLLSRDSSITTLKQVLEQKDYEMAQLNQRMEQKDLLIARQNEVIDYQNNEKLVAYATAGNYKELEAKGVLTKERGFLFFGKETVLQNEFPIESFEEVNILDTKYIALHGRKASVITNHPKDSYVFVRDSSEALAYLEITDPNAFWRVSKYAVIETR